MGSLLYLQLRSADGDLSVVRAFMNGFAPMSALRSDEIFQIGTGFIALESSEGSHGNNA